MLLNIEICEHLFEMALISKNIILFKINTKILEYLRYLSNLLIGTILLQWTFVSALDMVNNVDNTIYANTNTSYNTC